MSGIAINGVAVSSQNVAVQGNVVTGMAIAGSQVYAKPVTSTWSAADASAIGATLSNGGLTVATSVASWNSLRGTSSKTSGKLYVEILMNAAPSTTQWCLLGFASSSFAIGSYLGTSNYSMGFQPHYSWAGSAGFNAGNVGSMPNPATNDVWGLAIDFAAGNIWVAQNNTWLFSGNPGGGTGPAVTFAPATVGALFPALSINNGPPSGTFTLQPTAASQKYAPPAGFTAWDG